MRGTGILEGRIAEEPRGSEGFGFDPVFIPEGEERTVAELGDGWKAENSHRAGRPGARRRPLRSVFMQTSARSVNAAVSVGSSRPPGMNTS